MTEFSQGLPSLTLSNEPPYQQTGVSSKRVGQPGPVLVCNPPPPHQVLKHNGPGVCDGQDHSWSRFSCAARVLCVPKRVLSCNRGPPFIVGDLIFIWCGHPLTPSPALMRHRKKQIAQGHQKLR